MTNITKLDVYNIAMELIQNNGQTTSLEVKNELRSKGFYAIQSDVSTFLTQIADDGDILFSTNGKFRVYTLVNNTTITQPAGNNSQPITNSSSAMRLGYTMRNGTKIVVISKYEAVPNDVYAYAIDPSSGDVTSLYFLQGHYSRSNARYAFSKITGIAYSNCRAKKLK